MRRATGSWQFNIAACLNEINLLDGVALRADGKIEWDGPNLFARKALEAAQFSHRKYHKDWER